MDLWWVLEGSMRGQKKDSRETRRTTVDRDSQPNSNAFAVEHHSMPRDKWRARALSLPKIKEGIPKLSPDGVPFRGRVAGIYSVQYMLTCVAGDRENMKSSHEISLASLFIWF